MTRATRRPEELLDALIEAERQISPSAERRAANWAGVEARLMAPGGGGAGAGALSKLIGLVLVVGAAAALVGSLAPRGDGRERVKAASGEAEVIAASPTRGATSAGSASPGFEESARGSAAAAPPRSPGSASMSAAAPPDAADIDELPGAGSIPAIAADDVGEAAPQRSPTGADAGTDKGAGASVVGTEDEVDGEDGWEAELRLLQRAEAALREGRPRDALALTEEYERRWPKGEFVEAVAAARTLARCALGEDDARREYERAWPRSLYGERIRRGCASDGP